MTWDLFKYITTPRLQTMDTGNVIPARPYGPPPTDINGIGGLPILRDLATLQPGYFQPSQTALPVSVGGSSNQVYAGIVLDSLVSPPSKTGNI